MLQELAICLDLQARRIVGGLSSSAGVQLSFYQGDTYLITLFGQEPVTDNSLAIYEPAPISYSTIAAGLFAGGPDAPPRDGTWQIAFGADTTGPLDWNIGKGELATALNALASVIAAGGVKVLPSGPTHFYTVEWNGAAPDGDFTIPPGTVKLSPVCLGVAKRNSLVPTQTLLKIIRAPLAFTDDFTLPTPPAVEIARVRAGSTARNEVQSITVPAEATGQFALIWNSTGSEVVPVAGATAAAIAAALNGLYVDGAARFAVTNPATNVFYVEFTGALAKTAQPLLQKEMYSQVPVSTPSLELPITADVPTDLELLGAASLPIVLEIAAWDASGNKRVLAQQPVTLINNAIDAGLAERLEQAGAVQVITQTVTINGSPDSVPVTTVAPGYRFTPAGAGGTQIFVHDLDTFQPSVRVHHRTDDDPETWEELDDNLFAATATTANSVQITGLSLSTDPADANYFGNWAIFIFGPDATVQLLSHTHPTDEVFRTVDGSTQTLSQILDELTNNLPTGWPNIPANKIVGPIPVDKLALADVATGLASQATFATTLQSIFNSNAAVVSALATQLGGNTTFAATLGQVFSNTPSLITTLSQKLTTSSEFLTQMREVVLSVIQGGNLPGGATLMIVDDVSLAIPAPQQIAGPSIVRMVPVTTDTTTTSGGNTSKVSKVEQVAEADPTLIVVYPALSPALPVWTDGGYVAGKLHTGVNGKKYTASAESRSHSARGRRGQTFADGATLICTDGYWSEAVNIGGILYPVECEQTLCSLAVNDAELYAGSRFEFDGTVWLKLAGNALGRCELVAEIGTFNAQAVADISTITWQTVFATVAHLSAANRSRQLTVIVQRAANGTLTGSYQIQGKSTSFTPPGATFALRLRLTKFDCGNIPDPRGSLTLTMRGAVASIAALS